MATKKDELMDFLDSWADRREEKKKKDQSEGKGEAGNPPKKTDKKPANSGSESSGSSFLDELHDDIFED